MEHYGAALQEADWPTELLDRRLRVFERRVAGVPMEEIARELKISRRTAFYDWAEIRQVIASAGGPMLDEIRAKSEARFERLYTMISAEIATALKERSPIPIDLIREARRLIVDHARLFGVIQNGTMVHVQTAPDERRALASQTDDELVATAKLEAKALADVLEEVSGANGHNGHP